MPPPRRLCDTCKKFYDGDKTYNNFKGINKCPVCATKVHLKQDNSVFIPSFLRKKFGFEKEQTLQLIPMDNGILVIKR